MTNPEETARRLLDSISESLDLDPGKLARVAGQFITPEGNQVYPVRLGGRTVYVTVPVGDTAAPSSLNVIEE